MAYSAILIIYNPNSSGNAELKANRLAERLRKRDVKNIHIEPTKHAGHAEDLAYQGAKKYARPLIISVSGDGGYNEVVNGVMRAKKDFPKRSPTCAILAAGNANDHRRSVRKRPLTWGITHAEPEPMDLLHITIARGKNKIDRYAHSYAGIGFSSHAAHQLAKEDLGPIKEVLIVARSVFTFRPVAISKGNGKVQRYDSLVFANIHHMSKFFHVGSRADINNGSFRVAAVPYRSQWWLLRIILNFLLLFFGLKRLPQQDFYEFGVPRSALMHLDGEIIKIPANAHVTVAIKPGALPVVR